jgi:hypothetical protein
VIAESSRQTGKIILHADFLVEEQKNQAAQLELTTVYSDQDNLGTDEVFARHEEMLGQQSYNVEDSFTYRTPAEAVPGGRFVPAVIPFADDYLGLFNSDHGTTCSISSRNSSRRLFRPYFSNTA